MVLSGVPVTLAALLRVFACVCVCVNALMQVMEWVCSVTSSAELTLPLHGSCKAPVMYQSQQKH